MLYPLLGESAGLVMDSRDAKRCSQFGAFGPTSLVDAMFTGRPASGHKPPATGTQTGPPRPDPPQGEATPEIEPVDRDAIRVVGTLRWWIYNRVSFQD